MRAGEDDIDFLPTKPPNDYTGSEPPAALAPWRSEPVWVTWDNVWKADKKKWAKPPHSGTTGYMTKAWRNEPTFLATFDVALATKRRRKLAGIGISLEAAGLVGIDLDDCINDSGTLTPLASLAIGYGETYVEVSPSGEGLHFLALLPVDKTIKTIKRDDLRVELYHQGRYFTVTGRKVDDAPDIIAAAPQLIDRLVRLDAETPKPGRGAGAEPKFNGHAKPVGGDFFANVNAAALEHLDAWVPSLHPTAQKQATGAWRITSRGLGRDLEEDLAYHPHGVQDFGEEAGLTPIDAVLKYGDAGEPQAAARWLCQRIGVELAALGWQRKAGRAAEPPRANGEEVHGNLSAGARTSDVDDLPELAPWPILKSAAAHGIVGRIAHLATENSEADPAAVVATTIVYAAAEFGRTQFMRVGDTTHHSRHFNAIVGQSSRARKGTSFAPVQRIFEKAAEIRNRASTLPFPSGGYLKVSHGPLSSGEGLIYAVRDGSDDPDEEDKGVIDKRLLVVEEELGSALKMFQRTGNSLSTTLRRFWDGNGTIAPITKANRMTATDPHVNILGHITCPELRELLKGSEIWNGFANRFQWLMARRPKTVPFPTPMPEEQVEEIASELARVITKAHANSGRELVMSNSAMAHWASVYAELTLDYPGILGSVTSRQEAHARRLALTYAQLDGADRIEIIHLEAALAFTRYAFDSAAYLFGEVHLSPIAVKIMEALDEGELTQNKIRDLFSRNERAADIANVLRGLQERGKITLREEQTGKPGRPPRIWSKT